VAHYNLPKDRTYDGVSVLKYLLNPNNECNNQSPTNRSNDPHKYIYYWCAFELYAMRYYQYKVHWITRNGFGKEPSIYHNPP